MAITDKVYLRNHRRLTSQLETSFPRNAFHGATLDLLYSGDLDKLDEASREQVLGFIDAFLDCACDANPYCGHPEEKFVRYLLECRAEGHSPEAIVDLMGAEFGLTAYPGDIRSFFDEAIRTLEAAEAIAAVGTESSMREDIRESRESLL